MKTAVSAPGKVFLAGGYLVLDRQYTALVFGLSARVHVVVQDIDTTSGVELSEIIVESPQFRDAQWRYGYHLCKDDGGIVVTQLRGASSASLSSNPFVETALTYALTYIASLTNFHTLRPTHITILADDDYYSQPGEAVPSTASKTQQQDHTFSSFPVRLQNAHKTGLGSSAALVTAFTGALLSHYLSPISDFTLLSSSSSFSSTEKSKSHLHNLSQISHCAAQGKVGSGFDIATAVYGSCLYRRFTPSVLSPIGDPGTPHFATRLRASVENTNSTWDFSIQKGKVSIPPGMALRMCDVDCGSQTVGMVKRVLAWREQNRVSADTIWNALQTANEDLAAKLVATAPASTPTQLHDAISAIRALIQQMSRESGVPVEPPEQTALLDAVTQKVDGVVGGVVPGAGGYDAVVLLMKDDEDTEERLEAFLKEWSAETGGRVRLLGVRGEMDGARTEDVDVDAQVAYGPWIR